MSIERAEKLKRELTDKWVVVADQVPELRRFASMTGKVKTVNMNCRALVEFDNNVDISWYDIDPEFLTIVDGPRPKKKPAAEEKAKPAPAKKAAPGAAPAGGSPLDQIRAGSAAKPAAAGASPLDQIRAGGGGAAPAAKPAAGGSPLDQIRAQSGGGAAAKPAPAAGGSPLDQIRAQSAGAPAAEEVPAETEEQPKAESKSAELPPGASPLDQIRAQGGFKG